MQALGLTATGVIVRNRATGADYGFHAACADTFLARFDIDPLDDTAQLVIMGPLFAPATEWQCVGCHTIEGS